MITSERPSIDKTQMETARLWALRSTCDRMHVGAVVSLGGRTIGSGYNGAPAGIEHCDHDISYQPTIQPVERWARRVSPILPVRSINGCRAAIHAETNAIAYAARHGVAVAGATLYTTLSPCYSCAQLLIAAGLHRVVYDREYRDKSGVEYLRTAGLIVEQYTE